jgi:hypothetical protein
VWLPALPAVQVLQLVRAASEGKDPQQQQQQQLEEPGSNLCTWEAQSVLLLWLSMLVLTPFNLSTVDSAATNSGSSNGQRYTPLAATLLQLGESYLHHPGEWGGMSSPGPGCMHHSLHCTTHVGLPCGDTSLGHSS